MSKLSPENKLLAKVEQMGKKEVEKQKCQWCCSLDRANTFGHMLGDAKSTVKRANLQVTFSGACKGLAIHRQQHTG